MTNVSDIQVRWQGAALKVLLTRSDEMVWKPWIPASFAVAEIRAEAGCTGQAASGALRALLTVGLADRSETSEGKFWKPTEAAVRGKALVMHEFNEQLEVIEELIKNIDGNLDTIVWMQGVRANLDSLSQGNTA